MSMDLHTKVSVTMSFAFLCHQIEHVSLVLQSGTVCVPADTRIVHLDIMKEHQHLFKSGIPAKCESGIPAHSCCFKIVDAELILAERRDASTNPENTDTDAEKTLIMLVECEPGGNFVEKAMKAKNAGAIAVIVYNSEDGKLMGQEGDRYAAIDIPVVSIAKNDGDRLHDEISTSTTNISVHNCACFLALY